MSIYCITQNLRLAQARIKNDSSRLNNTMKEFNRMSSTASDQSDATIDASEDSFDSEHGLPMDHCNGDHPTRSPSLSEPSHLKSCLAGKSQRYSSNSSKSKVRFDKVELREYELILGDNPCTTSGPAIGLGWSYDTNDTLQSDIDSYEADRHSSDCSVIIMATKNKTKKNGDLRISPGERVAMLLRVGYSPIEIQESLEKRREDQDEQRRSSRSMHSSYPMFEKVVALRKTVKRFKPSRRQYLQ